MTQPAQTDEFVQFGGHAADAPAAQPEQTDEFAQFGGHAADADEFAQFGGHAAAAPAPASAVPPTSQPQPEQNPRADDLKQRNAIEPAEVDAIGAKHGLSKDQVENLKSLAPYLGAHMSDKEEGLDGVVSGAKEAVGLAGRAFLNAPQWLAKQTLSAPERAAWDEVQALAEDRKTGVRRAAETAGELAIGAGAMGVGSAAEAAAPTLGKSVATGAGFGAAQGFFNAKEGEGVSGAAKGAAEGAAFGAALHGLAKGAKALYGAIASPEGQSQAEASLQKVADSAREQMQSPEFQQDVQQGTQRVTDLLTKSVSGPIQNSVPAEHATDLVQFAQYLKSPGTLPSKEPSVKGVEGAVDGLRQFAAQRGDKALQQAYRGFREVQAVQDEAFDYAARGYGVTANKLWSTVRSIGRARGVMGAIDDRNMGLTQFEAHIDDVALADTQYRNQVSQAALSMRSDLRARQSLGLTSLDAEQLGRIEKGDMSGLSPEQTKALDAMSASYESLRTAVNRKMGSEVITPAKGVSRYIPRMQVDSAMTASRVNQAAKQVFDETGINLLGRDISEEDLGQLEGKAWDTLSEQMHYLGWDGESPESLQATLRQAVTSRGAAELTTGRLVRKQAGVVLSRGSPDIPDLPDSLRETDLNRLQLRWMKQAYQSAYTADAVQNMAADLAKLRAVGDQAGAEYVSKWMQGYAGQEDTVPKAVAAMKQAFQAKMRVRADEATSPLTRRLYEGLSGNTDVGGILVGSLYPNLLGFKPSTVFKAVMAPLTSTFPELAGGGSAWGAAKMTGGALRALGGLARGEMPAAYRRLESEGFIPGHVDAEIRDSFTSSFEHSLVGKGMRRAVDTWSNVALTPLLMAEKAARVIAVESASSVAQDLSRGSEAAWSFVSRMGRGYQARVEDLARQGDWEGVERTMQRFLVGKTLHYYSPTQMAEVGRTLGRWVSAFGTWPTAVAADIARDYARRGALGGSGGLLRKYLAPLGLLWTAQHYASAAGFDPEQSPRMKALTGAKGLTGAAPLPEAATRVTHPLETPITHDAGEAVAALVSGDANKLVQQMNNVGSHFVPFAGLVPLIDTTIPALLQNRPGPDRGETLPERVSAIARGRR